MQDRFSLIPVLRPHQHKTPRTSPIQAPTRGFIKTQQSQPLAEKMAVAVGFEPTVACTTQHFECWTFGRSDTLPSLRIVPAAHRFD